MDEDETGERDETLGASLDRLCRQKPSQERTEIRRRVEDVLAEKAEETWWTSWDGTEENRHD